ncbi:MAG: aminodeoxychorismate lyase [Thiohalocapsa sp.]
MSKVINDRDDAALVPRRAWVNGREQAVVGIGDRGLLYGDGLFETIAVRQQAPCRWSAHLARLDRGADRLGIPRADPVLLRAEADALVAGIDHGVLRLTLTRGEGGRGYRPPIAPCPTRILALYASPSTRPATELPAGTSNQGAISSKGVELTVCRTRLGDNPQLAGIKHLNRLEQVLARAEWQDPGIIDGVMTDSRGFAVCGTMTNLFLVHDDGLVTPALTRCGVEGTIRELVFERCRALNIPLVERDIQVAELYQARGLFVTNALLGLLPVARLGAKRYALDAVPAALVEQVRHVAFEPETQT